MKISPIPAGGLPAPAPAPDAQPQTTAQRVRALRMNTNATPGRVDTPPADPALTIPDAVDPAAGEETQPLSPQLAALAKQKRALQVKERELADKEKALLERTSTQGGAVDAARLKSDPLGVLLEAGVTYEQLTQAVLANQEKSPFTAVEAKLKALEESLEKKLSDRDSQTEQQVLAEMRREALSLVAQGDEFELVRETRRVPDVMTLIQRTYKETGEVLEVREALRLVEDELVQDSLKIARLNKVQSQMAPKAPPPPPPQQHRQMRTLTNRDTASVPVSAKARALAAFNGTLKK